MTVCVGPVAPAGAEAWIRWTREMIADVRGHSEQAVQLPAHVLDDLAAYVECWAGKSCDGEVFRWQVDVEPDELEYLTNALYNLDVRLADGRTERTAPAEARDFHHLLVRALLFALAQSGPSQSAFVDQLRPSWPVAADIH